MNAGSRTVGTSDHERHMFIDELDSRLPGAAVVMEPAMTAGSARDQALALSVTRDSKCR